MAGLGDPGGGHRPPVLAVALRLFQAVPTASWDFFIAGIAFAIFAAFGLSLRTAWETWVNLALGIWTIASPWVLGFRGTLAARDAAVVVGLVVVVMAVWTLAARHAPMPAGERSLTH